MFCVKCGNQVEDGSRFCPFCGAEMIQPSVQPQQTAQPQFQQPQQAAQPQFQQPQQAAQPQFQQLQQAAQPEFQQPQEPAKPLIDKEKLKNLNWKLIGMIGGIAAALIIVIIVIAVAIGNKRMTVKLNDYVTFESSGFDGHGTATATFNSEKFVADYGPKLKYSKEGMKLIKMKYGRNYKAFLSTAVPAKEVASSLQGELDKANELSNGDTVNYKWTFDEKELLSLYQINLKYSDIPYTVSGLDTVGTFDAFDGLELEYSGTSPNGSASVSNSRRDGVFSNLSYTLSETTELSNGDEITVKVSYDWGSDENEMIREMSEEYGEIPEAWEKTFTVEGLPYYVSKVSEIPEDTLASMQKQMTDAWASESSDWDSEESQLVSMDYLGSYLLIPKNGEGNQLYLIYAVNIWDSKAGDITVYNYCRFNDLKIVDGGLCQVDLSDYDRTSDWASFEVEDDWDREFRGFKTIEEIFSKCVTANLEYYTYDSNVTDGSASSTDAE